MEGIINNSKSLSSFPALSESSLLRYITFSVLYFGQGIPSGLMNISIPAWLVSKGLGSEEIAWYLVVAFLPWTFKLIAGPIMDRFGFLSMGRRRPWVLMAQIGLLVSFSSLSLIPDPSANFMVLAYMSFCVNFFTAFQDVAVDGLAIDLLPEDQQGRANGFMWGGKTIGRAGAGWGGSILIHMLGFSSAILILTVVFFVVFLFPLMLRERTGEKLLPWSEGKPSQVALDLQLTSMFEIIGKLFKALFLPMSIIVTLGFGFFSIGDGIPQVILPVLTVGDLGWDDTTYSGLVSVARLIAGILGMLAVGPVMDKLGKVKSLFCIVVPLVLLNLAYGFFPDLWKSDSAMRFYIFSREILVVSNTIIFLSISMGLSWEKVAATQFALYMVISNFSDTFGSFVAGQLDKFLEYNQLFIVIAIGYSLQLVFMYFVKMDVHQKHLKILDEKHG